MKTKEGYINKFEDEKRNLYLYYSGASELVAENVTLDEAYHAMNTYLNKVNFKTYYTRAWDGSDEATSRMIMDFGSHFKFFHWADKPKGDLVPERAFHGTENRTLEPKPSYDDFKIIVELTKSKKRKDFFNKDEGRW